MNDKPRTWTLVGTDPFELPVVEAGLILVDERVRVVELGPILDLLEQLVTPMDTISAEDEPLKAAEALLRDWRRRNA